eukprot:CAMPEP_0118949916 /NCGR_PEP_ID=MMETSP1169-20130426/50465_1 /TAXON_ID=36882 /ORGANISM="Pyramimonas obovata, Strain CCMP722" /LENGTH=211 /DNA_ID=CAMNT_0006896645 /DNA_START=17 /DNA_END=648 /DNA_ORIENTATION=+
MITSDVQHALQRGGLHVKEEALRKVIATVGARLEDVKKALLDADLRQIGESALPDNVNRVGKSTIKGNFVLQLMAVDDVSQPSAASGGSSGGKHRMLRLKVTDGKMTAVAVEYRPVGQLNSDLPPGTKLLITDAHIQSGIIMLQEKMMKVLGGRVDALLEEWEVQRKYKGLERPVDASGEQAPPFLAFDPKAAPPAAPGSARGLPDRPGAR